MLLEQNKVFFLWNAALAWPILCRTSEVLFPSSVIQLPKYLKVLVCLIGMSFMCMFTSSVSFEHINISVLFMLIFMWYYLFVRTLSILYSNALLRLISSGAVFAISSANLSI
uniref:Uncharacterized protein n=1 Tax=Cacopsylla melanoneura TaxID=428564 RepID=A0A8D9AWU2_9HEMI